MTNRAVTKPNINQTEVTETLTEVAFAWEFKVLFRLLSRY